MRVFIRKIRCELHDDCVRAPESAAGKQLLRPAARKRLGNGSVRQHLRLRRIPILHQTAIRHSDDLLPPVILHIGFERVRTARQERLILLVRQIFHFPHRLKQLERHRPRNWRALRRRLHVVIPEHTVEGERRVTPAVRFIRQEHAAHEVAAPAALNFQRVWPPFAFRRHLHVHENLLARLGLHVHGNTDRRAVKHKVIDGQREQIAVVGFVQRNQMRHVFRRQPRRRRIVRHARQFCRRYADRREHHQHEGKRDNRPHPPAHPGGMACFHSVVRQRMLKGGAGCVRHGSVGGLQLFPQFPLGHCTFAPSPSGASSSTRSFFRA